MRDRLTYAAAVLDWHLPNRRRWAHFVTEQLREFGIEIVDEELQRRGVHYGEVRVLPLERASAVYFVLSVQ